MKRIVTAVALTCGLFALSGIAVSHHAESSEAAGGVAKVPDGKPVFVKYKCASCHSIESQGIKKKGPVEDAAAVAGSIAPDLSGVGVARNADWIAGFLQKKEKIGERFHVKKLRGTDAELQRLAGWLTSLKDDAAAKKMKALEEKNEAALKAGTESVK